MELRHVTGIAARVGWILALAALISSCLVLVAGSAQADLEPVVRTETSTASAAGSRSERGERSRAAHGGAPGARGEPARERPRGEDEAKPAPEPELPEVENAAGEPLEVTSGTCEQNLAIAAKQGLRLPDGWKLYCVGGGLDWNGGSHWGVTCPYQECPEGPGPYVSISNPTYYVVAHELCHASFGNDELMADRCAARRGASIATSPYS